MSRRLGSAFLRHLLSILALPFMSAVVLPTWLAASFAEVDARWSGVLEHCRPWTTVFVLINHTYFVLSEEPGLVRRFGDSYIAYRERVPRWIPRPPRHSA